MGRTRMSEATIKDAETHAARVFNEMAGEDGVVEINELKAKLQVTEFLLHDRRLPIKW